MKKLLFVVDEKKMGGVSVLLEDILNNINLSKYQIDIMVLHNNGDYLDNLPDGIRLLYGTSFFDVVDLTMKDVLNSKNIFKILKKIYLVFLMKTKLIKKKIKKERKKCLKENYEIEIAFKDGFCALFTAYGNTPKKYHWLHTDYSMYDCTAKYQKLFNETFKHFDEIIGISQSVVSKFQAIYPDTKCQLIYNLIDIEKIKNKAEQNIDFETKINLISVGRIHDMKGYDRLVNVFNRLNQENRLNDVVFRLIGDGPDFDLVKSLVEKYNLQEKFILLGRKKNPYPYVKSSDAFIMCSRYEPFGLVILEAMILGTPVISTKVASIDEIMADQYGIITNNSEEGLYLALSKIIDHPDILLKYGGELQHYKYNTDEIVGKIERLFDK